MRLVSVFLALITLYACSPAFADAVIFSGQDVKALKYNLDLFGRSKLLGINVDPSIVSTPAPLGSIGMDYLVGNAYVKVTSVDTGWQKIQLSPVVLPTDVSGVLDLSHGGTNKAMGASAGSVAYSDADSLEFTAVGSNGQFLESAGAGSPVWTTPGFISGSGTVNFVPKFATSNSLSDSPIAISGSTVGIGTTAPLATLDIVGNINLAEISNPAISSVSNFTMYADSVTHTLLASINGGAYAQLFPVTVSGVFANTSLSNLVDTALVNSTNIVFTSGGAVSIQTISGVTSQQLVVKSGDTTAGASGPAQFKSGDTVGNFSSGNVLIQPGAVSGTASSGQMNARSADNGTVGAGSTGDGTTRTGNLTSSTASGTTGIWTSRSGNNSGLGGSGASFFKSGSTNFGTSGTASYGSGTSTAGSSGSSSYGSGQALLGTSGPVFLNPGSASQGGNTRVGGGDSSASGAVGGAVNIFGGTSTSFTGGPITLNSGQGGTGFNSGSISLTTANSSASSGNILLNPGITSTPANRGRIVFADGSEGTAGAFWKSTDLVGNGHWVSSASGVFTAPTIQKITAGSGTYTTPANVLYLRIRMVGAGGGGGGSDFNTSAPAATAGSTGGNTTFGTNTANGGAGGSVFAGNSAGGIGGTPNAGATVAGLFLFGGNGSPGNIQTLPYDMASLGGDGGSSCLGGNGSAGSVNGATVSAGNAGRTNSGGGGGGAGSTGSVFFAITPRAGGGGGAGACIDAIEKYPNIAASYSYSVGAGGTAGAAGGGGGGVAAGGAGGTGIIEITEYYQ